MAYITRILVCLSFLQFHACRLYSRVLTSLLLRGELRWEPLGEWAVTKNTSAYAVHSNHLHDMPDPLSFRLYCTVSVPIFYLLSSALFLFSSSNEPM